MAEMKHTAEEKVVCINCEKDCTRHYVMCDHSDAEWCPTCFENTACANGVHGEGCPTQVFSDDEDTKPTSHNRKDGRE